MYAYSSIDRFLKVDRLFELSGREAGRRAVQKDVENGDAFWVKKGTKVEIIETYRSGLCVVKAYDANYITYIDAISCD
jgi:hypothetical protein